VWRSWLARLRMDRRALGGCVAALLVFSLGGGAAADGHARRGEPAGAPIAGTGTPAPRPPKATAAPAPPPPVVLDRRGLTRALDRYLDGRRGSVSLAMRDLVTGNTYHYRGDHRYATASCAKVDILMTLLLRAQKEKTKPSGAERRMADLSIRYSDNQTTDRLWERIGGAAGMTAANRKFGVKNTRATEGDCLGLHCWGITDTTVREQIKLLNQLVDEDSPLEAANRAYVLKLMSKVIKEQRWGVSAAAVPGDQVALKNGWQKRTAHGGLWAINSIGRVRTPGHDFLIAVMSDHNPDTGYGIASVERVAEIAGKAFRKTSGTA
jgi:beta-lactamase class A